MATIKVKFRPSAIPSREGTIFYQIIHERTTRQILTPLRVFRSEWDDNRSKIIVTPDSDRRNAVIGVRKTIKLDIDRLSRIIRRLDEAEVPYSSDDIIDEYNRYMRDFTLFSFMHRVIVKLKQNGKLRTSETYVATFKSFRKFLASDMGAAVCPNVHDPMLDSITPEVMEAYEAWLRGRGIIPNTVSFYTRILRATYNRAVEQGAIENKKPFRHVYTGVDKTTKRALPLPYIRKIKSLDLSQSPTLDFARDMFILSFMLRGMSFIDMAFLRKSDLRNGYLTYRRRKTGQMLAIKWTREMQHLLNKYPPNLTNYLLPIIRYPGTNERCTYRNAGYNINHNLKKIANRLGITIPLTLYVARHSWASAARSKGIPLSIISEGMGHDSETTTQIYLASLDTAAIDRANALIIKSI